MDQKSEQRLFEALDRLEERVGEIDVTLAVNTSSLEEHIRGVRALEAALVPVEKHVAIVEGIFKGLGVLATFAGFLAALIKIFGK